MRQLGISQLKRIKKNLLSRNKLANNYDKKLNKNLNRIKTKNYVKSSYHLYPVIVDKEKTGCSRDELLKYLKKKINCQLHYIPIFEHPFHKISLSNKKKLPNAIEFFKTAISLPMYYGLNYKDQNYVINIINKKLKNDSSNNNSKKR